MQRRNPAPARLSGKPRLKLRPVPPAARTPASMPVAATRAVAPAQAFVFQDWAMI